MLWLSPCEANGIGELSGKVVSTEPHILDSGNRREFESGAVRDIQEGKGRCDLLPLVVLGNYMHDQILMSIGSFVETGSVWYLSEAIRLFNFEYMSIGGELKDRQADANMALEVAKHFEEGAKKYGDNNWQKGIPVRCYIDSAVRHYLKFIRGDTDEPHDRAFVWNLLCAWWTVENKPDLCEYGEADNV